MKNLPNYQENSLKTVPEYKKLSVRGAVVATIVAIYCILSGNAPPEVAADDNVFNVTVGVENIYTFIVTDSDNFIVRVNGEMPPGGNLVDDGEGRYQFRWTPTRIPDRALSFVAEDDQGAATLHSPILQICACFNGGYCTSEGLPITNQLIQNLTCICPEGNA